MTKTEQENLDRALRPTALSEYVGQTELRERLGIAIDSSRKRNEPIGHILLSGGSGLGKTTISSLIAKERGVAFLPTMAQTINSVADIIAICKKIPNLSCLFIDEIHALKETVQEALYSAMEDFVIPIKNADAVSAGARIKINQFTLIGATTQMGDLATPFRNRFDIIHTMEDYTVPELVILIKANAKKLGFDIGDQECENIAMRSRGTPRLANRLLKRVRDFAQAKNRTVDQRCVVDAMELEGIDDTGLTEMDIKYLETLFNSGGKSIGLNGIAACMQEDRYTIANEIEPYLIKRGLVQLTKTGRVLTSDGYVKLGLGELDEN